jgi:ribosomal-protein-alanine N-acetyltransferase
MNFPQSVPGLPGDRVHLRELTEVDVPAWFERATDIESAALAGDPIPESIDIGLNISSEEDGVAALGAVIGRAYWNKGFATCAAQLVAAYAFSTLKLVELRADLLQSNLASKRVLEKLGFQLVRTIPDYDQSEAGAQDGYLYVMRGTSR